MTEERRSSEEAHTAWRARIDGDVRSLSERLAGVETGMSSLGTSFDRFAHTFEASELKQQELGKTRWPIVFSSLTLALIIIGGFLSGYLRDLTRVELNLTRVEDALDQLMRNRTSAQDPRQDIELKDLNAEVTGMRLNEHKAIAHAADARSRINALERQAFGKNSVVHGDKKR